MVYDLIILIYAYLIYLSVIYAIIINFLTQNVLENKMADNVRGKYTLRAKAQNADETLDLNQGIDSEIDSEVEDEDEQPLINFVGDREEENHDINEGEIDNNIQNNQQQPQQPAPPAGAAVDPDSPDGWNISNWKEGDKDLTWLGDFAREEGFLIDMPENVTELGFFSIFLTDDVLQSITTETNRYARTFLDKANEHNRLKPNSRFRQWPENGISVNDLRSFIALSLPIKPRSLSFEDAITNLNGNGMVMKLSMNAQNAKSLYVKRTVMKFFIHKSTMLMFTLIDF